MSAKLYIAKSGARPAPALPVDAITRTFGVLGQRGTGKTTTATVLVEEMARRGGHVCVLDPVGVWWGVTRAGEKPGVKGIVLGGKHGDVPLEETGGELVADLVIGRHWPVVVIDMRLMRKGAQLRFMADFLEQLFQHNTRPLHVVFEEAHRALAQSTGGQMDPTKGRVLGAGEDLVMLGRSRGLGATLVTQRPAKLNKNVLEQAESLLLHRVAGPNDQKAVKGWIETNGDPSKTVQVMQSLAKLKVGEAWLYSPGWLDLLERVRIRGRRTYDSSATPEDDERAEDRTTRAPVNLDELRSQMASTVERAKANDPRVLRQQIAELERQLAEDRVVDSEIVEVAKPYVPEEAKRHVREADDRVAAARASFAQALDTLGEAGHLLEGASAELEGTPPPEAVSQPPQERQERRAQGPRMAAPPAAPSPRGENDGELTRRAERAVLGALLQYPQGRSMTQLAVITGYAKNGGGFTNAVARLRRLGYISERGTEPIVATPEGRAALPKVEPLPKGRALLDHWLRQLRRRAEREVLLAVYDAYPNRVTTAWVAEQAGYEVSGGGFTNAVAKLRRLELIEGRGEVRASDALFD